MKKRKLSQLVLYKYVALMEQFVVKNPIGI